jgi:1,4-alpha-glucan branching enzyme
LAVLFRHGRWTGLIRLHLAHPHAPPSPARPAVSPPTPPDGQYFHSGARGNHWMWDSRLFNYGAGGARTHD